MAKAIRKPPARLRYEQSHPTVSCRLDGDTHALLKQRLSDLGEVSFADFVKDALGTLQLKMPDVNLMRKTAREEGYKQAKRTTKSGFSASIAESQSTYNPTAISTRQ